ncbi:MAG: hypothetical protein GXO19_03945, partial [Epsilonproteobacteria bacterium]|nr:hypothetical protein [Campylobacterota bacterium]NPA56873.1 hypothetical protein [Campylobacterota bacterium]
MEREEALRLLDQRDLPLEKVREIFYQFQGDREVVGMVAMNLSLRTSVYERERGGGPIMRELLVALSQVEDMGSRWAVAKNPHTPVEVLERLAEDEVNLVRALVATNPNTPQKVIERLFHDEKIVRDGISGNPKAPGPILAQLARDRDKLVRLRVAENPATPLEVLRELEQDGDRDVAQA